MLPPEVTERYVRSGAWGTRTLPQRLEDVCVRHGGRVALIDGDRAITFDEAARMIERVAGGFAGLGVSPGETVSWVLQNRWEAAIVHHAALRAGAIAGPLLPGWGPREFAAALAAARPRLVITQRRWRDTDLCGTVRAAAERAGGIAVVDLDEALAADGHPPPLPDDAAADAVLLFTSGTASAPKGVLLSHRAMLCELDSFIDIHGVTEQDRYLCGPPVGHIAGLAYGLLAPFALGTSSILLPRWSPPAALAAIESHRATFMTGPPTFLLSLADDPRARDADLASFRLFSTGGASIHEASLRRAASTIGCAVKRAYGSTEVPTLTAGRLEDDETSRFATDGRTIGEAELRIVDPAGADVAAGAIGEIWARAPEMFSRYLDGAPALTDDGWFPTGDLGAVDADGNLRVTGRIKDLIIRGGENISALEVEELLLLHPSVAAAAVIGLPDERLGERACACVVVRDGQPLSFEAMIEHLTAAGLARHKLPERLELLEALPVTDAGKVRKAELVLRFSD